MMKKKFEDVWGGGALRVEKETKLKLKFSHAFFTWPLILFCLFSLLLL